MKYIYILLTLLSFDISAKENSYELFIDACKQAGTLKESWEDVLNQELYECVKNNEKPTKKLSQVLSEAKEIFEQLHKARVINNWDAPDPRKDDFNSNHPEFSQWRFLSQLGSLIIREKINRNDFNEAMSTICDFQYIGYKFSENNTLLAQLVHFAVQRIIILNNDMSILDKCDLSYLSTFNTLTNNNITFEEFFTGEKNMCVNSIRKMAFKDLGDTQKSLVNILKKHGYNQEVITKVEKGTLLSTKQWEDIAIKNYLRVFNDRMSHYQSTSPNKFHILTKRFEKEDEAKEIKKTPALIKKWEFTLSKITDKKDLSSLEELHRSVGEEISLVLNSMFLINFDLVIMKLKKYQSYERLILIRMAKRTYFEKTKTHIKTLRNLVDSKILEHEIIIDPLSQKEFLINDQHQVYGVGLDFDDDSGIPYDRRKKNGDFILPLKIPQTK